MDDMEPRLNLDIRGKSELTLIGMAIIGAQRVEFLLYGLGSHLVHLPDYRGKRFREMDPEVFLRGDPNNLKEMLSRLVQAFGGKLLLNEGEIRQFVDDRNLIAHNCWRLTKANLKGGYRLNDPKEFLVGFIQKCDHWGKVLKGLLALARQEAATWKGEDLILNADEVDSAEYYRKQVEACLQPRHSPHLQHYLQPGMVGTARPAAGSGTEPRWSSLARWKSGLPHRAQEQT